MLALFKKYWPHISGALAALVALYQLHGYVYQTGFNAGQQELISAHNKALEQQRKEYERKVQEALNTIAADNTAEIERLRSERQIEYITKEVVRNVEITVPAECDQLAADVVSLLSQAASIVISATGAAKSTDTE